jgi:antitoxin component of RelBE/YafQ-DinJ toxin-antitoxin module
MPRKKTERLNLSIDQTLKRQFDAVCALNGLSMSDIAQQIIREWVQKNAPPGLLEESEMAHQQQDKPPTSSTSAKGTGGKGKTKGADDE